MLTYYHLSHQLSILFFQFKGKEINIPLQCLKSYTRTNKRKQT